MQNYIRYKVTKEEKEITSAEVKKAAEEFKNAEASVLGFVIIVNDIDLGENLLPV